MGNLTYESDIFPTLSGLASRISALLKDGYIAGLWRSNLVEGFSWTHEGKRRPLNAQPKLWRAPSWSWASMTDGVLYKHRISPDDLKLDKIYATVTDVVCMPTGLQKTGTISSATLTLSGWTSCATIKNYMNS
ncbi:hypothetical protein AUP68_13429 [Ilyonectria robusta]